MNTQVLSHYRIDDWQDRFAGIPLTEDEVAALVLICLAALANSGALSEDGALCEENLNFEDVFSQVVEVGISGRSHLGIMLVGATGAGKSSTINALLQQDAAAIGSGADPQTKETSCYPFNEYVQLWDTPGLGDSPEEDAKHVKKIQELLNRDYKQDGVIYGKLIDIVLVIVDGSGRDIGTVLPLVKDHVMPEIDNRNILFVINQADMAMKGRHFDHGNAVPDAILQNFLDRQAAAIQQRIWESTGLLIRKPVVFSATHSFNLTALLDSIIDNSEWRLRKKELSEILFEESKNESLT